MFILHTGLTGGGPRGFQGFVYAAARAGRGPWPWPPVASRGLPSWPPVVASRRVVAFGRGLPLWPPRRGLPSWPSVVAPVVASRRCLPVVAARRGLPSVPPRRGFPSWPPVVASRRFLFGVCRRCHFKKGGQSSFARSAPFYCSVIDFTGNLPSESFYLTFPSASRSNPLRLQSESTSKSLQFLLEFESNSLQI